MATSNPAFHAVKVLARVSALPDQLVSLLQSLIVAGAALSGVELTNRSNLKKEERAAKEKRDTERRTRTSGKLEHAATLAMAVRDNGRAVGVVLVALNLSDDLAKKMPPVESMREGELLSLIQLYEPSLVDVTKALVTAHAGLIAITAEFLQVVLKTNTTGNESSKAAVERLAPQAAEGIHLIDVAYDTFMAALADRFAKYRL